MTLRSEYLGGLKEKRDFLCEIASKSGVFVILGDRNSHVLPEYHNELLQFPSLRK